MAFVGESRASQAYSSTLKVAQKLGYKTGFAKGMRLGATYFVAFFCYALLLWYGGYLVRYHYTNGGIAIATMFAVMIGGLEETASNVPWKELHCSSSCQLVEVSRGDHKRWFEAREAAER
ncbi:hypothetical protein F3Y22_tig00111621pilonHSYRG00015 [Hibiscus syriacus]|uniref:ABC transmembrane type-1 domain-containing protein n=1 Tax=Hibiscus syriacus TaxID=106335 RepID=A0A6A2YJ77_HIBSY|nr:hypothetical protein F3Y22_tig00111621pilonHSYRG00015 [Hibiscus syriacus]